MFILFNVSIFILFNITREVIMIISFLSQKGGVTKSTLARATATAFVNGGWTCHIADLDWQQQTSMKWSTRRPETKALVEVSVHKRIEPALKNEALYDVLLVDGRAASDRDAIIVAAKSNLVVLPTSTTVDDLELQLILLMILEIMA